MNNAKQIEELKRLVRGAYDLQKVRIASGLRLVANFSKKLGIEPGISIYAENDVNNDLECTLDADFETAPKTEKEKAEVARQREMAKQRKEMWVNVRAEHKRLTDGIVHKWRTVFKQIKFEQNGLIGSHAEFVLMDT